MSAIKMFCATVAAILVAAYVISQVANRIEANKQIAAMEAQAERYKEMAQELKKEQADREAMIDRIRKAHGWPEPTPTPEDHLK
jgi:cell division protein FtsL